MSWRVPGLAAPIYEVKAELFKALGHPIRVRVLELLSERDHTVAELLAATELEPSHLSGHLSVLRKAGVVAGTRENGSVSYSITHPTIGEILVAARAFLTDSLRDAQRVLDDEATR